VKNNEEFSTLVSNTSQTYSQQLKTLVNQLSDEAKANSGKFEAAFKDIREKLQETAQDLETKNPEFFQEAKKYRVSF
jgi:ABC-type transporter Mla subunit MlaD